MSIRKGTGPLSGIPLFCIFFVGALCLPLFEIIRVFDFLSGTKLPSVWHSLIYACIFLVLVGMYAFSFLLSGTLLLDCVYGLIVMRRIKSKPIFASSLAGFLLCICCCFATLPIRHIGFTALAERSKPLVSAIEQYRFDDEFFYSPTGKYTGKFFEHRNEKIGDWVYAQSID